MICPDCGAENRPGASFCTGCGTPLGTEETTFKLMAQDGTAYPITRPVTTIGREECDILLLNDDQVSRRHAQVEQQGDALVLTDLDSTNGTFVGGVRLQAPRTLQPGDVILDFTADPAQAMQINPYVMNIVEKVTAHKLQTRALDEAAVGNIAGATQKLRAAATRLLELGEEKLAQTAMEEAERLEQGKGLSAAGTKKLRYETRKL